MSDILVGLTAGFIFGLGFASRDLPIPPWSWASSMSRARGIRHFCSSWVRD